jgi:NAD(P)H-flavin reductase
MAFYVNPSWACTLFRNNKQHVVLGQKIKCQRVEESELWRIQRGKVNRSEVSSKWNKCRTYVGDQLDRWNELNEVLRVQTRAEVAKILLDR